MAADAFLSSNTPIDLASSHHVGSLTTSPGLAGRPTRYHLQSALQPAVDGFGYFQAYAASYGYHEMVIVV